MKMNKLLHAAMQESKKDGSYFVEAAKLDFALELEQQLRLANMNYADLAKKLGTSAAYISKVFRGDANMTIESMIKLCLAAGCQLDIRVNQQANKEAPRWSPSSIASALQPKGMPSVTPTRTTATILNFRCAQASHKQNQLDLMAA